MSISICQNSWELERLFLPYKTSDNIDYMTPFLHINLTNMLWLMLICSFWNVLGICVSLPNDPMTWEGCCFWRDWIALFIVRFGEKSFCEVWGQKMEMKKLDTHIVNWSCEKENGEHVLSQSIHLFWTRHTFLPQCMKPQNFIWDWSSWLNLDDSHPSTWRAFCVNVMCF